MLNIDLSNMIKKSLKIPNGLSESVNRKGTDNIIAKRKKRKRTNNDLQDITHKTKDRIARNPFKAGIISSAPEG
jgi:hypothetical protein